MNKLTNKLRVVVAMAMMLIVGFSANAYSFESGGIYYNITSSNPYEVEVTNNYGNSGKQYNCYTGKIVIPNTVYKFGNTYTVTSIGEEAFYRCYDLNNVIIPNTVTSIGTTAFCGCTSLTSIEIPNSVTSIGNSAFSECSGLTSIKIPNSVTSIGNSAFSECTGLTSIVVEEGNQVYDSRNNCNAIIETATNKLIQGCQNSFIPNTVTSIGSNAFSGCTGLTSIEISNSVTSIESGAFWNCDGLTSIEIPSSITYFGNGAFKNCDSLTTVVWNAVNCSDIISKTIFNGQTVYSPFEGKITSFTFGNNVKHIPAYLCYGIDELQNIEIPNSVTSIGSSAFYSCDGLTSIEIPNSVISIDSKAFLGCNSLTSVTIGDSVTSVGDKAFYNCDKLSIISLGNSLQTIGENVFGLCNNLKKIESKATKAPFIQNKEQFSENVYQIVDLFVPLGYEDNYKYAYAWSEFKNIIGKNFAVLATSITLDKTEVTLKQSESIVLTETILPYETVNKKVVWASSDESVATVDANGLVTAIAIGETTITATTVDGSNLTATCKVTVVPTLAISITLNETEVALEATQTAELIATVLPEQTTNKSVVWSSSDESVAIVDANGLATAIAVGNADITATTTDGSNLTATCKVTVNPTLATSITLDKMEISLLATQTAELTVTVLPELTTDKTVVWKSSNEEVATVDANGLVTAIAVGTADITATTTDGSNLTVTCKVTVNPTFANSIILDKDEISIEISETETLAAIVLPEYTTNKTVVWSSSNESVATVDSNGLVTAIAIGETTITAITTDGSNLTATCKVTVTPTLATSITLDKTEISLLATQTAELTVTILPELTTDKTVVWKSSNEEVATVDANGLVTAIAVGTTDITATTTDGSNLTATCKVTVVPTLAISIEVTPTEVEAKENTEVQLYAVVMPEDATNKEVEWSSSDESVATVDANGLVSIHKEGEATVTATTTDGSNLSASCKIKAFSGIVEVEPTISYVKVVCDDIVVYYAPIGSQVAVYGTDGQLVVAKEATDAATVITVQTKGIYLVKVGTETMKVFVK